MEKDNKKEVYEKNDKKEMYKKDNKRKVYNIINIIISILIGIFIFLELITWIITFIKDNSTINIFGYKPYIVTYDDSTYNLQNGDLAVGKEIKDTNEYIHNTGVIYKSTYKSSKKAVFLSDSDYEKIKNNSLSRYEGKLKFEINKLGKAILFFREMHIVILFAILMIISIAIICIIRSNKNDDLSKKYIRNRRIKDTLVILFIITTYASIFFIGKIDKNSGKEIINKDDENNIVNNVENNIGDNIENNTNNITGQNGNGNSLNNNKIESNISFIITEKDKSWEQIKSLSIFNNEFFNNENKIAPGVFGSYEFKVKNQSKYNIKYKIKIKEDNLYGINLKYKIKKNGKYLIDNYVSVNDLNIELQRLKYYETDTYEIEWKWVDNNNDTQIGENAELVNYNLSINVTGEMD